MLFAENITIQSTVYHSMQLVHAESVIVNAYHRLWGMTWQGKLEVVRMRPFRYAFNFLPELLMKEVGILWQSKFLVISFDISAGGS